MMASSIGSVLTERAVTGRHPIVGKMTVGMARVMNWTASHSGVGIWRIGSDYFLATCPAVTREGFPFTEISEPIRSLQDARDWLGY